MSNDAAEVGAVGNTEGSSVNPGQRSLNSGGAQGSNHDAILAGGLGDRNVQPSASDPNDRSEQTYSAAEAHDESGKGVGEKIKDAFKAK